MVLEVADSAEIEPSENNVHPDILNEESEISTILQDAKIQKEFNSSCILKSLHNNIPEENSSTNSSSDKKYIASLDIGTTIVKCFIYDEKAQICAEAQENVSYIFNVSSSNNIDLLLAI